MTPVGMKTAGFSSQALSAARETARRMLQDRDESLSSSGGVEPSDELLSVRERLVEALVDALSMKMPSSVITKATEEAEVALNEAHEAEVAAAARDAAAAHNDGTAGAGDEEYEGPRLIPLHISVLTYLVNKVHSDR